MLYLAGITIDFFLLLILLGKKDKSEADRILALWLFCIGLHLSCFYMFISGNYIHYPWLLGLEIPLPLIHGPFLYLYTTSLTGQSSKSVYRYLHFMPFLLAYLPFLSFLLSGPDNKVSVYSNHGAGYEEVLEMKNIAIIISGISYVILSLLALKRHRKNIENVFSNTERINLVWLRYLILGITCIWLVVISGKDEITFASVVLFVFFIGYFGIRQTGIFSHSTALNFSTRDSGPQEAAAEEPSDFQITETETGPDPEKGKYLKSGIDEGELHKILEQLNSLMERERLYTNPELTPGDAARKLNVHPNYLSQAINSITRKNFYDYVNSQRIEEFNRAVRKPENQRFTLLSLAFECGFNSKTSFNRNFRKITGLSPTEYLKQIDISLSRES